MDGSTTPSFWDRLSERQGALLVVLGTLALYIPMAGTYGLFDPWETHYGEVARQMVERGDFIGLFWPGSPLDGETFWSKPVLTFWLMAIALKVGGYSPAGPSGQLALGWKAEWALRVPSCLMASLAAVAVYLLASRLASRRAGLLAAGALVTMPLFALVGRQAMTDMAFIGPMSMALVMAAFALLDDAEQEIPRRTWHIAGRAIDVPWHPLSLAAAGLFLVAALPQLLIDSLQLVWPLRVASVSVTIPGAAVMLPYVVGFFGFFAFAARLRTRRPFYFAVAGTLAGLATLAKGLAGLGLPVIVIVVYLSLSGQWRRLLRRETGMGLLLGVLACAVVVMPWHHAMLVRYGFPFWDELYGDNHWRRLITGRHGDRGTFVYFLRELGFSVLPWLALAPMTIVRCLGGIGQRRSAARPSAETPAFFGAVWFLTGFAIVTASVTKFHHYILIALPGLALALGATIDEGLRRKEQRGMFAAALVGVPLILLVTFDLSAVAKEAQRFIWLFSYDYINDPKGRPWPPALDFRSTFVVFGAVFAAVGMLWGGARVRKWAAVGALAGAALFTIFLLDRFMPLVAGYWSQKPLIASYYRLRRSPDERLLVWQMYWRGENFYTENEIYEGPSAERTVFLGSQNAENFKAWMERHRGKRAFIVVERSRWRTMEGLVPEVAKASLTSVDESNMKFVLARIDL